MATRTTLAVVLNGLVQNQDLSGDELVLDSVKLGGGAGTALTKAILDNLVALQDGSDFSDGTGSHTHDGRYFTETELADAVGPATGSDLIGDDDSYTNFTPTAATVKGALEGIDSALSASGGLIKVSANDSTPGYLEDKVVAGAGLSQSTLNDAGDEDLSLSVNVDDSTIEINTDALRVKDAGITNAKIASGIDAAKLADGSVSNTEFQYINSLTSNAQDQIDSKAAASVVTEIDQNVDDLIALSGVAENATTLGTFTGATIPDSSTIKAALQSLETKAEANAALIAGLEWQDSALDYIIDNTVAPATEVSGDRYILSADGGAPHADYDGASAGSIVEFNGSVWVETVPTTGMFISADDEDTILYYWGGAAWEVKAFEATTASTGLTKVGLDIRLADAAENASGIKVLSGAITLEDLGAFDTADLAEGTSLYFTDERAQDAIGTIFAATSTITLSYADATPEITADVNNNSIDENHLTASVAGNGLTGGNGSALAVGAGAGIAVASDSISVDYAPQAKKSMVAGESFAADTTFLVRMALTGETAGRVYKATNAAAAADGKFYAFGVIEAGSALSAADPAPVIMLGTATLGASDTPFGAGDVGKAVYLTTAGGFSVTAPSSSGAAVWRVGVVQSTTSILVVSQGLNGIA